MEPTPKISIIVPVYNVAPFLPQCMDSLIGQTYQNLEIICIDDGSTDTSNAILDQYAASDKRILCIHQDNAGLSAARNRGLDAASGKYLLFVDADDWIEPDTCEKAMSQMLAHSADLVLWPYIREYPDHSAPKEIFPDFQVFPSDTCRSLHRRMAGLIGPELAHPENADALCTVWGKLYRRALIAQHRLQFTDLKRVGSYEDGLFNLHYLQYTARAVYIPDYLNHYRKNVGVTSRYRSQLSAQWSNLFADIRTYLDSIHADTDYYEALQNRISLSIIGLGLNAMALPAGPAWKEVHRLLSNREYRTAIKTLPMRYFPPHWWVFFACGKLNFASGVFLLLKCMERMKR